MNNSYRHKQRGAATVLLAGILLFLMTFVVLFTGRSEVNDIKSTTTDFRIAQAQAAAQAGLEIALAQVVNRPTIKGELPLDSTVSGFESLLAGNITFGDSTGTPVNSGANIITGTYDVNISEDGDDTKIWIESTGTSGDGSSTKTIKQFAEFVPVISYIPTVHAVTKDAFNSSLFTSDKDNNDIVVWAGKGTTDYDEDDQTIKGDSQLAASSGNDFFRYFFSGSKNSVRAISEQPDCSSTCSGSDLSTAGLTYWVDGDITISGGTIGSSTKPVVLIIDNASSGSSTLTITNGAKIYGFIYVTGDWNNGTSNSGTIYGAVAAEGELKNISGLTINKNGSGATALANLGDMAGAYVVYPGSWTDL